MPVILRRLGIVIGVLVVLSLIAFGAYTWFLRRAYPQTSGTITIQGVSAPVDIYRDSYGVPHIYAQTTEDLFFAQGYVLAQDRFWQMEFQRRVGSGRLSEILGKTTLSTDIYLRVYGFRVLAQEEYDMMDGEGKKVLNAYADGVNAYILNRPPSELGLEFALLELQGVKFAIEPWTPLDSLVWAHMMIYDQSDKMRTELRNLDMLRTVGREMSNALIPPYRSDRPTIVTDDELKALDLPQSARLAPDYSDETYAALMQVNTTLIGGFTAETQPGTFPVDAMAGSNSWAISGRLTATGRPMLANDPHMSFSVPSIWYEVDLHCVEKSPDCIYQLRGYALPGVPGVLIGHNDRIAWGLTNAQFDSQDLYIERINPENPDQYEVNGQWVNMDVRREEITVRGQDDPAILMVRSTRHGPVVTDDQITSRTGYTVTVDGEEQLYILSLRWTALEPIQSVQALLAVNRAQDWEEFRRALSKFDAGTQNFIYADVDGNIGYQLPGLIPIRADGDGSLPVPGWTDQYEWTGFIPYDELPRSFNPEKGYIATANNPQVTSTYPYLLNRDIDYGQREARIVDMIESDTDGISIEDMRRIQRDNLSLPALEMLPYLEDLDFSDNTVGSARDQLLKWDGQMIANSPEAALYALFWDELLTQTFNDQLPENLWPSGGTRHEEAVYYLLKDSSNAWWDDRTTPGIRESRDEILVRAFENAYERGEDLMGKDMSAWQWGKLHTIKYVNAVLGKSGISQIESIFNLGPYPVSGSESVVNKVGWSANDPFVASIAPAMRFIVDLGDLSNSLMIIQTGQSGHPGSPHYSDLVSMWLNFDYQKIGWERSDVESGTNEHLILQP